MSRRNLATINHAGVAALRLVVAKLLPGGETLGRDYIARARRCPDGRPGSFGVKLFGAHAGTCADFATGDRGGDPVLLVAYLERMSQADAPRRLAVLLGSRPEGASISATECRKEHMFDVLALLTHHFAAIFVPELARTACRRGAKYALLPSRDRQFRRVVRREFALGHGGVPNLDLRNAL